MEPHSRASPLPHLTAFQSWNTVKSGSGLAREEARPVTTNQTASNRSRNLPISSRVCAAASNSRSRANWYIFSSN
ncbi:hypothetical protein DBR46_08165 [Pseudomonas sp. KBW05]|nr:hypothetical protein DBR46_08165 [Pseudomonas sp. KBW05]